MKSKEDVNRVSIETLVLQLTRYCNLQCQMCFTSLTRSDYSDRHQSEMKYEIVAQTLENIPSTVSRIILTGGEPLSHSRIEDVLGLVATCNCSTKINTNGTFLNDFLIDALLNSQIDEVAVSIDGPADIHDMIRGVPGTFRNVSRGIAIFLDKRRQMCSQLPKLTVNVTIQNDNIASISELVEVLSDMGIDEIVLSPLMWSSTSIADQQEIFVRHVFGFDDPSTRMAIRCERLLPDLSILKDSLIAICRSPDQQGIPIRLDPVMNNIIFGDESPATVLPSAANCTLVLSTVRIWADGRITVICPYIHCRLGQIGSNGICVELVRNSLVRFVSTLHQSGPAPACDVCCFGRQTADESVRRRFKQRGNKC